MDIRTLSPFTTVTFDFNGDNIKVENPHSIADRRFLRSESVIDRKEITLGLIQAMTAAEEARTTRLLSICATVLFFVPCLDGGSVLLRRDWQSITLLSVVDAESVYSARALAANMAKGLRVPLVELYSITGGLDLDTDNPTWTSDDLKSALEPISALANRQINQMDRVRL